MHSVKRSPEPGFFAELRAACTDWDDLDGGARRRIRDALFEDFGSVCAYCERSCEWPNSYSNSPNQETIDHFRPRSRFPGLWLDWLNLVYSCHRCNQAKSGSWPGHDDEVVNQRLAAVYPKYTPVSEYVNPNEEPGQRPVREFFDFNVETGEVTPADRLDNTEWSTARRTISDIDLNDSELGENEQGHLWNRRRRQRDLLMQALSAIEDFDEQVGLMRDFALPGKPFSGFISAYLKQRFPEFGLLFQQY